MSSSYKRPYPGYGYDLKDDLNRSKNNKYVREGNRKQKRLVEKHVRRTSKRIVANELKSFEN